MSTDVGFMRPILFYGIFFTSIAYLTVIIPIVKLIISSIRNKQFSMTYMFVSFLITLVIIEIKGEIFYRLLPLVIIYFLLFEIEENRNKNKKNNVSEGNSNNGTKSINNYSNI